MLVHKPGRKPLRVIWELLPGQLYIGGTLKKLDPHQVAAAIGAPSDEAPDAANINVVLNVGQHDHALEAILQDWAVGHVGSEPTAGRRRYLAYHHFSVPDSPVRVPIEKIQPAVEYAVAEIAAGNRVLSMCYGGRNRSGLLAALTIMRTRGCSGADAYALIRAAKPNTFYNELYGRYVQELPAHSN
jgi:hypothetical protein